MADVFEYLRWRGDLTFDQSSWNEVDGMILARLSYLPCEGLVGEEPGGGISLESMADGLLASEEGHKGFMCPEDGELLRAVSTSPRFATVRLSAYVNNIDKDTQTQFAAVVFSICRDWHVISFRGTDDTLVGWKEDFNMSFTCPVPAQRASVLYLERVAGRLEGRLMLTGHSKGGNLAVYSASFCSLRVQSRVSDIYNYDGPGFQTKVLASPGYRQISGRVRTYVPQASIVGMLLGHEEKHRIVYSQERISLLQHDVYSWGIERDHFIYLDETTQTSRVVDAALEEWLRAMNEEERGIFIDTVYGLVMETKANTLKDLGRNWLANGRSIVAGLKNMDDTARKNVVKAVTILLQSAKKGVDTVYGQGKTQV